MKVTIKQDIDYPCGLKFHEELTLECEERPVSESIIPACPHHGKDCKAPSVGTVIPYTPMPSYPVVTPTSAECTCLKPWLGIIPPPPCPVHGGVAGPTIWCGGTAPLQTWNSDHTSANPPV